MKRFPALLLILLTASAVTARAQVAPSATRARGLSVTAGGIGSFFQPDYGPNRLGGIGAYVDVKFTHWIQVEGEGRWLRFNQLDNVYEDNYLIGPRVPLPRIWKAAPYAKVLVGDGKMNFQFNEAKGNFTALAYGGGVDLRMSKRWSFRAIDVEYQQWPKWVGGTLSPYGISAGIGYKIF